MKPGKKTGKKANANPKIETHGAHGRFGVEEESDISKDEEFVERSRQGYRNPKGHDPSEPRRNAERDAQPDSPAADLPLEPPER